jgi:hypothetical protein
VGTVAHRGTLSRTLNRTLDAVALERTISACPASTSTGRRQSVALRHGWINDDHLYVPEAEWGGMKRSGSGRELGLAGPAEYQDAADRGARRRGGRVAEETYDRVGGQQ